MSDKLAGIVLAHADLAQALVSAVQAIAGSEHGLVPISNQDCDRAQLTRRIEEAIAGRAAVVFADMPGGSCAFSAAAFARGKDQVRVVTGVNLAMLLDFAFHRDSSADEAAARAAETGRGSVTVVGGVGARG